jgi:hypothetical protein
LLNASGSQNWLSSEDLNLQGELAMEWNAFLLVLRCSGVTLNREEDSLVWTWNQSKGVVTVKFVYEALVTQNVAVDQEWWQRALWKLQAPVKIIFLLVMSS